MATKTSIFLEHLDRYVAGSRQQKRAILDHVCFVTQMHRKAATRKFSVLTRQRSAVVDRRGRRVYYTPDVTAALRTVWEAGNEVCGELLFPSIDEYVAILERDDMWPHGAETTSKLRQMKLATVKRRVGNFLRARECRRGITATRPSQLKVLVPTFSGPWHDQPPGYGQVDSVLHNDTAQGDAVYSVNYTDAATLLVVPRAQWNKGQQATHRSLKTIRQRLPFAMLGLHPDTGAEFLNWQLKRWTDEQGIDFTRSRAGKKNDNMYVEERNGHVIRRTVGYVPLTTPRVVPALNALYDVLTSYLLHFVAVRRQVTKEKVASKYRRVYEKEPKTPYQRILNHPAVSEESKARLRAKHATLNPLVLKREIDHRLDIVYALQNRYGTPKPTQIVR